MMLDVTNEVLIEAREYAKKASPYTHLHNGWEDTREDEQLARWMTGGVAQNMVRDFCNKHNVKCVEDSTSHKENDLYDLEIKGFKFDVKGTHTGIQGQVNKTSLLKACNGKTHAFFFVKVSRDMKKYKPLGFCTSKYYGENCKIINEGDIIPHTKIRNRFGKTYVLDEDKIQYKGIESLIHLKERDFPL